MERKISLGIGAYRGDDGEPYVLPVVRKAEKEVLDAMMNHEYAGIQGVDDFLKHSFDFVYGAGSQAIADGRADGGADGGTARAFERRRHRCSA